LYLKKQKDLFKILNVGARLTKSGRKGALWYSFFKAFEPFLDDFAK